MKRSPAKMKISKPGQLWRGGLRWSVGLLAVVWLTGIAAWYCDYAWGQEDEPAAQTAEVAEAETADTVEAAPEAPREPTRPSLEALRAEIVSKNIFRPARIPPPVAYVPPPADPQPEPEPDMGPRRLTRPFRVVGFTRTPTGRFAFLHFENPPTNRQVQAGDTFEFVTVLEVNPPFIRCDYDGHMVRLGVSESSDDAYIRLVGLSTDYKLLGTTISPGGNSARFYFPAEGLELTVEEGDSLGNAEVIRIEHGRVTLMQMDGNEIVVR